MRAEIYESGTNEEYHDGPGVSNSQLSEYAESPALYHGRFVTKTIERRSPTAEMKLGTLLHELVLENTLHSAKMIPSDVLNKDGHRKGRAWTDFASENAGFDLITSDQFAELIEMRDAILRHEAANKLLAGANEREVSLRMTCPLTGMLLRCKLDMLCRDGFCADLKTTRDPSPREFAKSVATFSYHRQDAFYRRLASSLCGVDMPFFFIAIGKDKPYRVEVYKLETEYALAGEAELDNLLRRLAKAYETDNWQFDHYGDVLSLPMPRWMQYSDEWETV